MGKRNPAVLEMVHDEIVRKSNNIPAVTTNHQHHRYIQTVLFTLQKLTRKEGD